MSAFENEYRYNSLLSERVVFGFISACNNIYQYGIHTMAEQVHPAKLTIKDDDLRTLLQAKIRPDTTHIDSGHIGLGYKDADGDIIHARVWMPLEHGNPEPQTLLGNKIQIATVCRDKLLVESDILLDYRDIVSTREGRIYEIVKKIDVFNSTETGLIANAVELTTDDNVEAITDGLIATAKTLKKIYQR